MSHKWIWRFDISKWTSQKREHGQKISLSESIEKENSWRKCFFQILLNELLKICEKRYMHADDVKANKNKNKRSGGCILQILIRSTFKTWNTM